MKRVIYKNKDNSVSILIPSQEALSFATIEQIAEKDVPHNLPYWIIPTSDIPTDRTFRNAWEIDESFGEPDGFGGENNEFDEELLRKYYEVIDADKN
ncbi:hypothetical protein N5T79_06675 [Aliarcobacter cryaerophilus]|uniref:hypothetical protein n=1 Tax=Aliarcobacter cryaerophilus TaxID=28198 RepID=UPI0021B50CB4|nr:hypothetical protein [Aliarcobacter cryaerophilus]MCT7528827.1 hypothetical protein [Aliarcobacter cryaerophilus]